MARKTNSKKLIYALLALFLLVITLIGGQLRLSALAETVSHTSALADLQKDSTFKTSDYPDSAKDYSIKVIQIAEGVNGELYLYTYQPCQKTKYLIATDINMSLSADLEEDIDNDAGNNNQGTGGDTSGGDTGDNQGTGGNTDTDKPGLNGDGTGGTSGGGFGGGGGGGRGRSVVRSKPTTKLYSLTLINTSGVFGKYKVDDFIVGSEATRYYNITSIYRNWDKDLDGATGNDNTVKSVSFEVGKCFIATTGNGEVKYGWEERETIEVVEKHVGYLRYVNGVTWTDSMSMCDSHYVAFLTNRPIEELYEVDIEYMSQYFWRKLSKIPFTNNQYKVVEDRSDANPQKVCATIEPSEVSNSGNGLFGKKHTWNRIEKTSDFIKNEELTDETQEAIKNTQWVLRFTETGWNVTTGNTRYDEYTEISEVTILRLKFMTGGVLYNLGVVDNKQTGGNTPGNVIDTPFESSGLFGYVWSCLVKLFSGKASVIETVVAVIALAVALFVVAVLIWFGKLLYRLIFK